MNPCPQCQERNADEARFCHHCGALLVAAASLRERRVVSVLFCDLAGFTATSDHADPEDVEQRLGRYFGAVRGRVEAYGGLVEKYIGDAVVGVFGAPVAHEDDPERAVRSALSILAAVDDLNRADPALALDLRVAVTTGEVLVNLGARPELGEPFVTGDVVNTASRLQGSAPLGQVLVDVATHIVTERTFEYEAFGSLILKGKAEAVPAWRAIASRARLGTMFAHEPGVPLVGREPEMAQLAAVFDRVVRDCAAQLVVVVGEPGAGKSRLVGELLTRIEQMPELVVWRAGQVRPYGDATGFAALGEIVKSHAGVYDTDSADLATVKLEAVLPPAMDPAWLRARLLPLVGVSAAGDAPREQSFAAWRMFIEHLADAGPAVVVFEDIQWADQGLLDFVRGTAEHADRLPLLLVATGRPEVIAEHPDFVTGLRNVTLLDVAPLRPRACARLLDLLAADLELDEDQRQIVVERSGGNPLFASEYVHMLRAAGSSAGRGEHLAIPGSVQALLTARLDLLDPQVRAVLQDAAVVGRVFWTDATAALGGREPADVSRLLKQATQIDLVQPARRSSMGDQEEYSFAHALIADAAYQQMPRVRRATLHLAAAEWLSVQAAERLDEVAETLAHHTSTAYDLAAAAGDTEQRERIRPKARDDMLRAADRLTDLDTVRAFEMVDRARVLTPGHDVEGLARVAPTWAKLWTISGSADQDSVDVDTESAWLEQVSSVLFEAGRADVAADTLAWASACWWRRDSERAVLMARRAADLLVGLPTNARVLRVLAHVAATQRVLNHTEDAWQTIQHAEQLRHEAGLALEPDSAEVRGNVRLVMGDVGGLRDIDDARRALLSADRFQFAATAWNNLACNRWLAEGTDAALATIDEAIAFTLATNSTASEWLARGTRLWPLLESGRLDEVRDEVMSRTEEMLARSIGYRIEAEGALVRVLLETANPAAKEWADTLAADVERGDGTEARAVALAALDLDADLDVEKVRGWLRSLAADNDLRYSYELAARLPGAVRLALRLDEDELAERICAHVRPDLLARRLAHEHGTSLVTQYRGDDAVAAAALVKVASGWRHTGNRMESACALLAAGSSMLGSGDPAAVATLSAARDEFDSMGAVVRAGHAQRLLRSR